MMVHPVGFGGVAGGEPGDDMMSPESGSQKNTFRSLFTCFVWGGGSSNDGPSGDKTFYIMVSATTMNEHISKK